MKKFTRNISIIIALAISQWSIVRAQAPQAIPYQAVARDVSGNLIANQSIGLQFTIIQGSIVPVELYKETQNVTTNEFGLFSANVGQGTPVLGTFAAINWGLAPYPEKYLKVEMDAAGGTNYINMGQSQMLSVPYALFSANSGNGMPAGAATGNTMYWDGFSWINDGNLFNDGGNIGIGTTTPNAKLHINSNSENMFMQLTGNLTGSGSFDGLKIGLNGSSPYIMNMEESDLTFGTFGMDRMRIAPGGNVGIDAITPEFKLTIDNDGGILAKGTDGSGADLATAGAGTRMIWYPKKSAFRAGTVNGTQWDDINIGSYSFASGNGNTASGNGAAAMGNLNNATGDQSFAAGTGNTSGGFASIAAGNVVNAEGDFSVAFGNQSTSSGINSRAIGFNAVASGNFSTAIGTSLTASGTTSTAIGNNVSTNGHLGALIIGDSEQGLTTNSSANDEFTARFKGGYKFFTDSQTTATGAMYLDQGKLSIGTSTHEFRLSMDNDGGIIAKGTLNQGNSLQTTGNGVRMIWYPKKAAFRAGNVFDDSWDDINIGYSSFAAGSSNKASGSSSTAIGSGNSAIGNFSTALGASTSANGSYSTAIGVSTIASGFQSTAMGSNSSATGPTSTAMGYLSSASGVVSTAMGNQNTASGENSTAMGSITWASGSNSTAMGASTVASGITSTAIGENSIAGGNYSIAIGRTVVASGDNSTAMGNYVSTNGHDGAFIIGDNSTATTLLSAADNGFRARFASGYRLFSDAATTTGVFLSGGGGAWTSISDRNKKENFRDINNEDILLKVGALPMSNWNYKAQPATQRHIGCMAQDFYAAFHLDGESDTTINTLDIDGINMAAIQALKTRTDELRKATDKIDALTVALAKLEQRVDALAKEDNHTTTASAVKETN